MAFIMHSQAWIYDQTLVSRRVKGICLDLRLVCVRLNVATLRIERFFLKIRLMVLFCLSVFEIGSGFGLVILSCLSLSYLLLASLLWVVAKHSSAFLRLISFYN